MVSQSVESAVRAALEPFASDEVMLDAFWQWASIPTSMSAGYGIDENYGYIQQNLRSRYGLTEAKASEKTQTLSARLEPIAETQYVYALRNEIQAAISGTMGQRLKDTLRQKLEAQPLSIQCAVALLAWLRSQGVADWKIMDVCGEPPVILEALLRATLGHLAPSDIGPSSGVEIRRRLLDCGIISPLFYRSTRNNTRMESTLGPLVPLRDLSAVVPGNTLPSARDYLIALFDQDLFGQARAVEEVALASATCGPGVFEVPTYRSPFPLEQLVSIRGIVGKAESYSPVLKRMIGAAAINPLLREELMLALGEIRAERILGVMNTIGGALESVRSRLWPQGDISPLKAEADRSLWRLESSGTAGLVIFAGNWMGSGDLQYCHSVARGGDMLLVIVADQSLPDLKWVFEGWIGNWGSVTVVLVGQKGVVVEQLKGEPHPAFPRITEDLRGTGGPFPTPPPDASQKRTQGKEVPTPSRKVPPTRESILIGTERGSKNTVSWEPGKGSTVQLPNRNVLVVGKPGTGKSQMIKAFILELRKQKIPSVVLDWVGEHRDVLPDVVDAGRGVTFNPLELPPNVGPYQISMEVASIIRHIYTALGDVQEAVLRDAVSQAFEERGIVQETPETWRLTPPTLENVARILGGYIQAGHEKSSAQGVLMRIDPLIKLGLFKGKTTVPFGDLVSKGSCIVLEGPYTDDLRIIMGQFFLHKLWYHVLNLGPSNAARFYLMLDEAHRLDFPDSPLEKLAREARKFGVGLLVASQRPSDFTDTIPANAACVVAFQCPLDKDAVFIAKQMKCDAKDIQGLWPNFDAMVKFDYEGTAARVNAVPYYEREKGRTSVGEP